MRDNVGSSCSVARMFERRKARLDLKKKLNCMELLKKEANSMKLPLSKKGRLSYIFDYVPLFDIE